jgi:hypothetical protein
MHRGTNPALERHYVPTRSQRTRSVLTFFAQDSGTHNLVYAKADISKVTQHREAITFCDHWKAISSKDPKMLVMDQKVTNQKVLGELDARGVKFITLRMRSATLVRHITSLIPKDYKAVALDRPGPNNRPKGHEDKAVRLTSYPRTVRQLVLIGLGRDQPTVIITNEERATPRQLISQYARRITTGQRLAEIIRSFCADALSSAVNLNVDLEIMLCVLAQALLDAFHARHGPGYATATPDTLQSRFFDSSEPSPPAASRSPSGSTAAPTHPFCARPPSRPTPPCPGGTVGASTSSSANQGRRSCMEIGARACRLRQFVQRVGGGCEVAGPGRGLEQFVWPSVRDGFASLS